MPWHLTYSSGNEWHLCGRAEVAMDGCAVRASMLPPRHAARATGAMAPRSPALPADHHRLRSTDRVAMALLCSRLAPCCRTRVVAAALARCMPPCASTEVHAARRHAFGSSAAAAAPAVPLRPSSSSSRAAHVCRSYADPEVYSIAFNFRKFDQEVSQNAGTRSAPCRPSTSTRC